MVEAMLNPSSHLQPRRNATRTTPPPPPNLEGLSCSSSSSILDGVTFVVGPTDRWIYLFSLRWLRRMVEKGVRERCRAAARLEA